MTDPIIPTEDDFAAFASEALQNNRVNGLPAKAPTEIRRKQPDGTVAVWTSTSPESAKAWVDDMIQDIRLRWTEWEIDEWVADNQRSMGILEKYFPDEDQRLCDEIRDARQNARTIEI